MDINSYWSFFLGFSSGASLLFAFGELAAINPNRKQYLLFWIHLILSYYLFHSYLIHSGLILKFWFLFLTPLPLFAILGTLFERFLLFVWNNKQLEPPKILYLKMMPAILSILLLLPFYLLDEKAKIEIIRDFQFSSKPWNLKLGALLSFATFFYFILSLFYRMIRDLHWNTIRKSSILQSVIFFSFFSLANLVFGIFLILSGETSGQTKVGIVIGTYICLLYILRQRFPEFFEEVSIIIQKEKQYSRSQLGKIDLETVRASLMILFENEEVYLDEDLTLSSLAIKLGLSVHQLSEYLNTEEKKNFFQLVNEYRVEKAKEKISDNPELSMIRIAYDSGFNSKSNFNQAFKRITETTPSQYRDKVLKDRKRNS